MIVHLALDIRSISPSSPARPTAYARLNEYARLLSELNEHYDDEDLDRVVVSRYSDELSFTPVPPVLTVPPGVPGVNWRFTTPNPRFCGPEGL
jgi:hypothetical protein